MTDRHYQIVLGIETYLANANYAPSVGDVAIMIGLRSASTAHANLVEMRRLGLVDWVDRVDRTLHVTELGRHELRRAQASNPRASRL